MPNDDDLPASPIPPADDSAEASSRGTGAFRPSLPRATDPALAAMMSELSATAAASPAPAPVPAVAPPAAAPHPPLTSTDRNVMLVLAYLGPFSFLPLAIEKGDPVVQAHAKHGLVMFVADIVAVAIFQFLAIVLSLATGGLLAPFFSLLVPVFWMSMVILHLVLIVSAINGVSLRIPAVSGIADRL